MNSSNKTTTRGGARTDGPEVERRYRKRVKVAASIRVRSCGVTNDCFEDVCTTVDVSGDGILFTSSHRSYRAGQQLAVTFPYPPGPTAINAEQKAEVVRVTDLPGGQRAVALRLLGAMPANASKDAGGRAASNGASSGRRDAAEGLSSHLGSRGASRARAIILAVSLEADLSAALCANLEPEGYDIVSASPADARGALRKTVLAIIDVATDGAAGYEFCRHIKSSPQFSHIPVILVTGEKDPTAYADISRGAVMCVARPVEATRLLRMVRLLAPPSSRGSAYSGRDASRLGVERSL